MNIEMRSCRTVNTDPQRRCYNGCHYSSELVWAEWVTVDFDITEDHIKERLLFWRELNDYAISQRGESARSEFRKVV